MRTDNVHVNDTMRPALAATLQSGEFAPTLNLDVSFAKPARIGALQGKGHILKRGKEVCLPCRGLHQDGELVASATATAIIRRLR